jgi:hypothetical protein
MVGDGREWLATQPLPETARQQITVAVAIVDALEREIAPLDRELRFYARRQTGCQALIEGECHKVCVRQERMEPHAFNTTEEHPIRASLL